MSVTPDEMLGHGEGVERLLIPGIKNDTLRHVDAGAEDRGLNKKSDGLDDQIEEAQIRVIEAAIDKAVADKAPSYCATDRVDRSVCHFQRARRSNKATLFAGLTALLSILGSFVKSVLRADASSTATVNSTQGHERSTLGRFPDEMVDRRAVKEGNGLYVPAVVAAAVERRNLGVPEVRQFRTLDKKEYADVLAWYINRGSEERFTAEEIEKSLRNTDSPQSTGDTFHAMFDVPYEVMDSEIAARLKRIHGVSLLNYLELSQMRLEATIEKVIDGVKYRIPNEARFGGRPLRPTGFRREVFEYDPWCFDMRALRRIESEYHVSIDPQDVLYTQSFVDKSHSEYQGYAVKFTDELRFFFHRIN